MSESRSAILTSEETESLFLLSDLELEQFLKSLPTDKQAAILQLMATYRTPTEMATESLIEFVRQAWHVVEPATEFKPNWHIDGICKHLEAVVSGDVMNIIFNIPPGCMKSLLCCVLWPAWVWTFNPAARFLYASYDSKLSIRDSRRCRELIESPWYQARWGAKFQLTDDQNQKIRYDTTERGWRMATSVGGAGTGEHPNYIVADDPQNVNQSGSEVERQTVNDWWDGTISSRGVIHNSRRIIVMQRLHEDDLSGHVLAKGGFDHFCLPMRFEPERKAITSLGWTDPRTVPGELLWASAFPEEAVQKLERNMTPLRALGQLQQRPTAGDGLFFKVAKLQVVPAAPSEIGKAWRAWDFASSDGDGDYTAGVKMAAGSDGLFYILDVQRGQWATDERRAMVKLTAGTDGRQTKIRGPQDPGSAGVDAAQDFGRMLAGYSVKTERVTGTKESRAEPFASQVNMGNVRLVEADWNHDFVEELRAFPVGKHDDQVDAAADAFHELTGKKKFLVGV